MGHLQCIGACFIVFFSFIYFNILMDSLFLLLVFYLLFYIFYLFNRLKEIKTDFITNPERTNHLLSYRTKAPIVLIFAFVFLLLVLFYLNNVRLSGFIILFLVFGLLYTIFFKKATKYIPLFKNIYVAFCFGLLVFAPFIYSGSQLTTASLYLSFFVFFKIFLIQILLDIKDVDSDKIEKLKTFPVMFGIDKTFCFLYFFSFFSSLLFSFFHPIFFITFFWNIVSLQIAKKIPKNGYLFSFCEVFLWFLIIIYIKNA